MTRLSNQWTFGFSLLILLLVVGALAGPTSVLAQANTFTWTFSTSIDSVLFYPCALGGAGEIVAISGTIHNVFHVTLDPSYGMHGVRHSSFQGVSGTGLTSGIKYQATGVYASEFNGTRVYETNLVQSFRFIGQGPGNNFLLHNDSHITVSADGTLAVHDHFREITCQ